MSKPLEALSTSETLDALEAKIDGAIKKVSVEIRADLAEARKTLDDIEARATKGHFSCPIRKKI